MKNIFSTIGHFFENVFHLFKLPGNVAQAESVLAEVQSHIPAALNVVQEIETLIPNHETEAVLALASRFGFVATETMTKPEIETLIQNVALAKLQQVVDSGTSHHILRSAISLAVNLWKAHVASRP